MSNTERIEYLKSLGVYSFVGEERPERGPHPDARLRKGGDLYTRPLTAEEMAAPLAWHEGHTVTVWRYGVLSDGRIGHKRVK